jgi:hypothetical protein
MTGALVTRDRSRLVKNTTFFLKHMLSRVHLTHAVASFVMLEVAPPGCSKQPNREGAR